MQFSETEQCVHMLHKQQRETLHSVSLPAGRHSQPDVTPSQVSLPAGCHSQPDVTPSRASLPAGCHSQLWVSPSAGQYVRTPRHIVLHKLFSATHFSTLKSKLSSSELSSPPWKQSLPIAPRYSMTQGAVRSIWRCCRALLRMAATGRGCPSTLGRRGQRRRK